MEVSKAGHIKAIAIAVLFVMLMSLGCILGYHYLVQKPVEKIVLRNKTDVEQLMGAVANINGDLTMMYVGMDELNQRLLIKDIQIEKLLTIQELFFLIEKEQTNRITTLERRHLEVIRALAILQKDHWPEKLRLESSGHTVGKYDWGAWLKAAKTPEGKTIKDSEKVIENW